MGSLGQRSAGNQCPWLSFLLLQTTALLFRNENIRSDYNKGKGRNASKPVQLPKQVSHIGLLATVCMALLDAGKRRSGSNAAVQVTPDMLKLLLDYCQFHRAAGRSDKVSFPGLARHLLGVMSLLRRQ